MNVSIVTDSTSDLPADLAESLGVRVVPLSVNFGTESLLDGVTIKSDEFYRRLKAGPDFPKTSQPSAGAFVDAYREAARESKQVLSIHLSSKVSGTYNSAVQARLVMMGQLREDELVDPEREGEAADRELKPEVFDPELKIEVIDTLQASMALGLVVAQVAAAVKNGADLKAAAGLAKDLSARARFFGLLDTLEYLHRGGRVGRAQLFLGSLLNIKPILGLVDGVAHPIERARSRSKGTAKLLEMTRREGPLSGLAVMYSDDRRDADRLAETLKDVAPLSGIVVAQFGPVLGTYLGPGALGVCLVKATDRPAN